MSHCHVHSYGAATFDASKRKEKKEEKYWQWDLQTVAHVKKHSEIFERIFIPKEKNDHFCIHLVSFKDWGSNDSKSSSIVIESCLWRAAIAAGMMVGLQPYSAKGTFVWKSRLLLPKQTVWIAEWSKAWLKAPQLELPKVRIPVEGTLFSYRQSIVSGSWNRSNLWWKCGSEVHPSKRPAGKC